MQQVSIKGIQDSAWFSRRGDLLGIAQEIKIWPYYEMAYA